MAQLIKLSRCRICGRVRKHGAWIFATKYQMELMKKYYNVEYVAIVCDFCRKSILSGTPIP